VSGLALICEWAARLRYARRRHGTFGLVWLAAHNLVYHGARFFRARPPDRTDPFDQKYGTDTGGVRNIATLDVIDQPAALYAVRYRPSSEAFVRASIEKLKIDPASFTFVDFGSGKGRVLLVAATFPFKQIVGVEFSRELHEIAVRNIARLPPGIARAGAMCSFLGDAAVFELPKSDLVCYFNNPFGPPVLTAVVARLAMHHELYRYRIMIIYHHPRHREIFERTQKFVILEEAADALLMTTSDKVAGNLCPRSVPRPAALLPNSGRRVQPPT
jgi:hypothetical protein